MTNQHPITPPSELINKWVRMLEYLPDKQVFSEAIQWGADQELEACCHWLKDVDEVADELRFARRPKPPSLKEQALEALDRMDQFPNIEDQLIVRRALEALND